MISKKEHKKLLYEMIRIREVETTIANKYHEREMRCPVHLSIGQEAVAVGVCNNLNIKDQILSAHRSHAHYIAKGGKLKSMIAELYGKKLGCAEGKGGSMHLFDLDVNMMAAVPIVGSTIPIGVGVAWSNKLKKNNKIVTIFFGDGATEEGVFQESLDFASLHNLKVLFVCENNLYSVFSHINKRQSVNRKITKIAEAIGIKSNICNGNDILKVNEQVNNSLKYMKKFNKPSLIEFKTYRYLEHCGPFNDDHLKYRNIDEIKKWKNNCPIKKYKNFLLQNNIINNNEITNIQNTITKEINNAFKIVSKFKFPSKNELMKNIYA